MKRNEKDEASDKIRSISTNNIDELAQFQLNKNRRYTQLQPGVLKGHYLEINMGDVQIFREKLTAGSLIEAAPAESFVPFAAVLSNADNFNFCGKKREKNTILQATGGYWDACFSDNLNFVVAAFNKDIFSKNIEHLTGKELPNEWLVSKTSMTDPYALNCYATGLNRILNLLQANPEILSNENALRMLCDSILRLTINVLNPTISCVGKKKKQSNRHQGTVRVIDYLHSFTAKVPTIPELCQIANLSERNLQYGFKEYLGVTPIRYLRLVRLNAVRRDLLISPPRRVRVVDVALKWGFIELGRFSGEYQRLFQELPSTTLLNVNTVN